MSDSVDEIADQLYGLVPAEFTAARDEQVTSARQRGDRSLAEEIKQLRRPTVGAWLVNLLARARRPDLERLLEVGHSLRVAQAKLDRQRMRQLSDERHELVGRLSEEARSLAAQAGQQIGEQVVSEVTGTLDAAVADEAAAQAVDAGRLTTSLRYAGLGSAISAGFVATGPRPTRPTRRPPSTPRPPAARSDPQAAASADRARAALDTAQQGLDRARAALAAADNEVLDAEDRLAAVRRERVAARQEVHGAEREFRRAEREARRTGLAPPSGSR